MQQAIGYIRVSTTEQEEGVSLDVQGVRIWAYCEAAGLTLARKEAGHVVVSTLDRSFRSTVDCLETVQAWNRAGIGLHVIDHGGQPINTASAVGCMERLLQHA